MGEDPNYVNGAGADEPNFTDQSRLAFTFCEEHVPPPGPRSTGTTPSSGAADAGTSVGTGPWPAEDVVATALDLPGLSRMSVAVPDGRSARTSIPSTR